MSVFVYMYFISGPIRKIWTGNIPLSVLTPINSYAKTGLNQFHVCIGTIANLMLF
jgi:hypothetical protein